MSTQTPDQTNAFTRVVRDPLSLGQEKRCTAPHQRFTVSSQKTSSFELFGQRTDERASKQSKPLVFPLPFALSRCQCSKTSLSPRALLINNTRPVPSRRSRSRPTGRLEGNERGTMGKAAGKREEKEATIGMGEEGRGCGGGSRIGDCPWVWHNKLFMKSLARSVGPSVRPSVRASVCRVTV